MSAAILRMQVAAMIAFATTIVGCAAWQIAKPPLRGVHEIARQLCEATAAEASEAELAGMSPRAWCDVHEHLAPFIDAVAAAQQDASRKAGLAR